MGTAGTLEEILFGPGKQADGTLNLIGALRRAMATTGYSDLKEFQRVEVVVSPYTPLLIRRAARRGSTHPSESDASADSRRSDPHMDGRR